MKELILRIYLPITLLTGIAVAIYLLRDIWRNRSMLRTEPGHFVLLSLYNAAVQFLSALGVSDFSIHIVALRQLKLVRDENLPGTMIIACAIPQIVMGLSYVSVMPVDPLTLAVAVLAAVSGALLGVRFIMRLPADMIRLLMAIALLSSCAMILLGKSALLPVGGSASGLAGWQLILVAVALFFFSALNMGGFSTVPLLLALLYALGVSPASAYAIAMGSSCLLIACGTFPYVKSGRYNRKIVLSSTIFGSIGAAIAVYLVRGLNVALLQWLIAAVTLYGGAQLLHDRAKKRKQIV